MFLVGEHSVTREARIRALLTAEPPIAVILAAVNVEWTVRRAVLALGRSPNRDIRQRLVNCHGLDKYKELWKAEVSRGGRLPTLPQVVREWAELRKAFVLRHRLVHGANSCTAVYAMPRVEVMLAASADIRRFCADQGVDLHDRLKVRRKARE